MSPVKYKLGFISQRRQSSVRLLFMNCVTAVSRINDQSLLVVSIGGRQVSSTAEHPVLVYI
jgi:hypothetical protein